MTDRSRGEPTTAPPDADAPDDVEESVGRPQEPPLDDEGDDATRPDDPAGAAATSDQPGDDTSVEAEPADPLAAAQRALEERTGDLQRLQAEYLNYKRRVDRDRELVRENATYTALVPIIDVLDTIDRARDSARSLGRDLDGGFQTVADQLERAVERAGLTRYGAVGDPFDPRLHEALSHIGEDPDVEVTTCKVIAKAGYRIGDRVVRAAQVLVVDPVHGA